MPRLLLIVDPQYDFINGTLPVPGAAEAMDSLAKYIRTHASDYVFAAVTADWHPADHCSFDPNGGPWPVHCVAHSQGAAIYDPILQALIKSKLPYEILTKGTNAEAEEYSVMLNGASAERLRQIVDQLGIDHIDICGLAGDVCVLRTLLDAADVFGRERMRVLTEFSPSLDRGVALGRAIESLNLK